MTALLLAFVLCITFGAGLFAIFGSAPARDGSPDGGPTGVVLVIAPPWGPGAPALVARTGGRLVGPVTAPFGSFATFDGPAPADRLRALGAWGTREAGALATLCGIRS
ncbi:hypothetical protein [Salipiger mangrovisoli]|nr:hypothetical protein [Salipiger mangrovisoli]